MELIKKTFKILDKKEKLYFFVLLFLIFISMLLEMLTIGLIFPILNLIMDNSQEIQNYLFKFNFLENFFLKTKEQKIILVLIFFIVIIFLKSIYGTFLAIFMNKYCYDLKERFSKSLFESYLNKKYKFFIDNNSSVIIRNIKDEPDLMVNQVIKPFTVLLVDISLIIGIIIVLFLFDPLLTLLSIFLFMSSGILFINLTNKKIKNFGYIRQVNDGLRIKNIHQAFSNIIEIMILNAKRIILKQYIDPNKKSSESTRAAVILQELPRVWLEMLAVMGLFIITYVMLEFDRKVEEIIPVIGLFALAAFKILPTSNRILASITSIKFGLPTVKVIVKNLKQNKKIVSKKASSNLFKFKNRIEFKNVNFSFKNKKKIFNNLNFSIKKNTSVAIVGESGSGKSTLLNLLLGFYKPKSGNIFIDRKKLDKIKDGWISNIGYVSQVANIIDESLKKNIAFGKDETEIDKKKLFDVIKKSNLDKFLKNLPRGINTFLGERGLKISGGQRQRITIARSMYSDPSIIIFDEATNSLDTFTEEKIIDEILKLKKEKTLIFVTHRTNNLKKFDKVYELSNFKLRRKKV